MHRLTTPPPLHHHPHPCRKPYSPSPLPPPARSPPPLPFPGHTSPLHPPCSTPISAPLGHTAAWGTMCPGRLGKAAHGGVAGVKRGLELPICMQHVHTTSGLDSLSRRVQKQHTNLSPMPSAHPRSSPIPRHSPSLFPLKYNGLFLCMHLVSRTEPGGVSWRNVVRTRRNMSNTTPYRMGAATQLF
jgi:hypothetical protein